GPPLVADAGTGQVDHGGDTVQGLLRQVSGGRVPGELVVGARRAAYQPGDLVPGRAQLRDQRLAEAPRDPGSKYVSHPATLSGTAMHRRTRSAPRATPGNADCSSIGPRMVTGSTSNLAGEGIRGRAGPRSCPPRAASSSR